MTTTRKMKGLKPAVPKAKPAKKPAKPASGKRSNVKDAHDKYANQEVAYSRSAQRRRQGVPLVVLESSGQAFGGP